MIKELSCKEYLEGMNLPAFPRIQCFKLGKTYAVVVPNVLSGYDIVFSRCLYPDFFYIPVRCETHEFTSDEEAATRAKAVLKDRYENPQYSKELGGFKFASTIVQASDGFVALIHATHFIDPSDECDLLTHIDPCIFIDEVLGVSERTGSEKEARILGSAMLDKILKAVNSGNVPDAWAARLAKA